MPILNATPSKHIYNALAQDVTNELAISDLIDNAIDNWKYTGSTNDLIIHIKISENEIIIKDNAGGVSLDALKLLLMPGGTNRSLNNPLIKGIWGVGSKRALFSLGKKFTISTKVSGENGLVMDVPEEWFLDDTSDSKWEIDYQIDNSIEEGTTCFKITNLKDTLNDVSIEKIKKTIKSVYSKELTENNIKIFFNNSLVGEKPNIPFAYSAYAPVCRYSTTISVQNTDRSINFEMLVGIMTKHGSNYEYGIDFYGNNRIILQYNLDYKMGFIEGKLGRAHQTINRFRAEVKINGLSKDIPWNSSKGDINTNHHMYITIRDLIYQIARPYTQFLRKNYEVTAEIFNTSIEKEQIQDINFDYPGPIPNKVRSYTRPKKMENISFQVSKEQFDEVVNHYGLQNKYKKQIGLFLFNKILEEVRS